MSSENNPDDAEPEPTEEDLDSDVGTVFSDEEEGKQIDDGDDEEEGGVGYTDDESGSSSSSDSDDGSEKCPICLQKFSDQEIGTPEMCEHQFCLRCITAWSKKVATCPIDRKFFSTILVKKHWSGDVIRIEGVKFPNSQANEDEYDSNPTYCEICGRCDREERLLLCDGCDLGYHLECLDPPLEFVPIEDWFCPSCVAQDIIDSEDEAGTSNVPRTSTSTTAAAPTRIPRTRLNERILRSLETLPEPAAIAVQDAVAAVISAMNSSACPAVRSRKRRTTTRKRKSTSKRKTTKASGSGRKRRSRRKTRRRRRVAVDKRPNTARGRIAHHLGITPPLPGQVYVGLPPASRSSSSTHTGTTSSSINSMRYNAGITPLRMFGGRNDWADLVDSCSDEEAPTSSARLGSIHEPFHGGASPTGSVGILSAASAQSSSCDVLGSILKKQYILLNDKNVKIARDGTLVPSMTSRTLPASASTVSQCTKTICTTSPSSPESYPGCSTSGSGSPSRPKMTVCGTTGESNTTKPSGMNNGGTSSPSTSNTSAVVGSSSVSSASRNNDIHHNEQGSSGSHSRSSEQGNMCLDEPRRGWSQPKSEDEDDVDIYSDIEEQDAGETDNPASAPPASDAETEVCATDDTGSESKPIVPGKSTSSRRNPSQDSLPQDENDSECEMVIDEESQSGKSRPQTPAKDKNQSNSEDNLPESPGSIPLPDSPPPPDFNDDEDDSGETLSKPTSVTKASRKTYDPSDPLNSSDEESDPKGRKDDDKQQQKPESPSRLPMKSQGSAPVKKGLNIRRLSYTSKASATSSSVTSSTGENYAAAVAHARSMSMNVKLLPSSEDQNHGRRNAIQFSIPKRHNLIPISSLMKRQKGVAKKDSKGLESTISFQSEISKAFGGESPNEIENNSDTEDNTPKVSLVAEIFGSDEEEESEQKEEACVVSSLVSEEVKPSDNEIVEKVVDETMTIASDIDMNSGRWKTISEVIPDPVVPDQPVVEAATTMDASSSSLDNHEPVSTHVQADEDPEIIEIVTLNTAPNPKFPKRRRFFGQRNRNNNGAERRSDSPNLDSDIEIIDEVSGAKQKTERVSTKEKENRQSRSGSRSSHHQSGRKRRRRASHSSPDQSEEKRRKKERKRKLKRKQSGEKERRGSTVGSSSIHGDISSGDNMDENLQWKNQSGRSRSSERRRRSRRSRSGEMFQRNMEFRESPFHEPHFRRSLSRSPQRRYRSPGYHRRRQSMSPHRRIVSGSPGVSHRLISRHSHDTSSRRSPDEFYDRARKRDRKNLSQSPLPKEDRKAMIKSHAAEKRKAKLRKLEKQEKAKRKLKELKKKKKAKLKASAEDKLRKINKAKRKRKREKSPSPVKAITADGDSIVVSLNFQTEEKKEKKKEGKRLKSAKKRLDKENSVGAAENTRETKAKSPSVHKKLFDLGAEDLSSNSEPGGVINTDSITRDKEFGASTTSDSVEEAIGRKISRHDKEQSHYPPADSSKGNGKRGSNDETEGDSVVTSTRDLVEPSVNLEEEFGIAPQTPPHSKSSGETIKAQNVSSTERSPRVHPGSASKAQSQRQASNKEIDQKAASAQMELLNSASAAYTAAALTQPSASNYSVPMLNPVLATVATALFAARQQQTTKIGASGGASMSESPVKSRNTPTRAQGRKLNFGGAGDTSPLSPNSSDGDDLFEPPTESGFVKRSGKSSLRSRVPPPPPTLSNMSSLFDDLFGNEANKSVSRQGKGPRSGGQGKPSPRKGKKKESSHSQPANNDMNINSEEMPASAVELSVQEKLLKKLNRQERVIEEVKLCLKPHYIKKHVDKEEYKEILRRAVPKVCHSKTGEINPFKVRELVEAYVRKFRHDRKKP